MRHLRPPISNNLVFTKVMSENKDLCIRVAERMLGQDIEDVEYLHIEHKITSVENRSVQLDVVLKSSGRVVNLEMQTYDNADLGRRMFMHHALMAVTQTPKGAGFSAKPDSYVIFICTFDPFGEGHALYTLQTRCGEALDLDVGDGVTSLVYNASGDLAELPEPVANLLKYIRTNADEDDDDLTRELAQAIDVAMESEGLDMGIATWEQEMADRYAYGVRRGAAEERERIAALADKMAAAGKSGLEIASALASPDIEALYLEYDV